MKACNKNENVSIRGFRNVVLATLALMAAACNIEPVPVSEAGLGAHGLPAYTTTAWECSSEVVFGEKSLTITHTIWELTDKSRLVQCEVLTAAGTSMDFALWPPGSEEAANARCKLADDVDSPSGGGWVFLSRTDGSMSTAQYLDSSSQHDSRLVFLTACKAW